MKTLSEERLRIVTASMLVLTMLFPPFIITLPGSAELGCGFGFIFSWPEHQGGGATCRIDTASLIAEWVFVGLLFSVHQWMHIKTMWLERLQRSNKALDGSAHTAHIIASAIVELVNDKK